MSIVYLRGAFIPEDEATISPLDRGFLFGDGLYEVIPVYFGSCFGLTHHYERLVHSLGSCQIPLPFSYAEYSQIIESLLEQNTTTDYQKIYIHITRGESSGRNHTYEQLTPTVYIRVDEFQPKTETELLAGVQVGMREDTRWHRCDIKSTSLLANVLHIIEAKQLGYEEMILTRDNIITEGASSNIFIVKNGALFTPQATNKILHGITRKMVLESAKALSIPVHEADITTQELLAADEVWITSSTREIMPVARVEEHPLPSEYPMWQRIYAQYQSLYSV